jgi:hypothetical protein
MNGKGDVLLEGHFLPPKRHDNLTVPGYKKRSWLAKVLALLDCHLGLSRTLFIFHHPAANKENFMQKRGFSRQYTISAV